MQTINPPATLTESFSRAILARERRLDPVWEMSTSQRVEAMRGGKLTREQLAAWSARCPDQMPLLQGEYEWIAAFTPEVAE